MAGDMVIINVDQCMAHDGNGPLAIEYFYKFDGKRLHDSDSFCFSLDHYVPCPNESVAKIHDYCRAFAAEQGCLLFEAGEGVCHQLMMENGRGLPGQISIASDSHTCTYGALNCFATGVGSTDIAAIMLTGKMWAKVPESMKVELVGSLHKNVAAKDIILTLAKKIRADGATYRSIEFTGEGAASLSIEERMTICNMAVEVGGKAGLFLFDDKTAEWFDKHSIKMDVEPVYPDQDAVYSETVTIDLGKVVPQIALPHCVDNVEDVADKIGMRFEQANLGTCTNGRLNDLIAVRDIIKGKKIHPGVRCYAFPASRRVFLDAMAMGVVQDLCESGVVFGTPGCGCCVGACNGIPGNGNKVLSTANRNFRGRMGNTNAEIYLVSPQTLAVSILEGKLSDPTK